MTDASPGASDASSGALVTVDDLDYARPNGLRVLEDLSLSIAPAEVVAVVGPSGCGKSTLLSLLAGLLQPTGGSITRNIEVGRRSGARGRSGVERNLWLTLMFQEETLLPWRSVERNVRFGLERMGLSKADREGRSDQLLSMVGLAEFARTLPMELSGGMRRRAQFAACVAPLPRLLLLDEPFSALDEPTRVGLHADVLKVVHELGIAVVLVTHDIAEAVSLADRVVVLTSRPGKISEQMRIPFGRDRDLFTLRQTEEYEERYRTLWELVWNTIPTTALT